MLVARRDPVPDPAHDAAWSRRENLAGQPVHTVKPPSRIVRLVTGVQMFGSVLAIPIGLASAYSIYHSNFSPEARCQGLRANIISMLDKSADASTLRMLVRRDVISFQQSCGAVDPEAVAAFKQLLAPERLPAIAVAKPESARPVKHEAERQPASHEVRQLTAERVPGEAKHVRKTAAKTAPEPREKPALREAVRSDADWLDAVRHALVDHSPVVRADAAEAPVASKPTHRLTPLSPMPPLQEQPALAPIQAAPSLPPASNVARVPAPEADDGHPVPPGSIPNVGGTN
ncbi:MAG TPA: hypothetical protein VFT69_09685 [Pseudolabrys sp.]|nr:hypothetical protein [Pseudolabrys sp.]